MYLQLRAAEMRLILMVAMAIAMSAADPANGGTKTELFGWEDGTSTASFNIGGNNLLPVFNSPDVGTGTLANVSTGSTLDLGPSGSPFEEPVPIDVTPRTGSRMLEVTLSDLMIDPGTDAFLYLGVITGLDPGDTYQYSFFSYDFSEDRSPSATRNATYARTTININSFDGFAVALQRFTQETGWLEEELDGNGPTSGSVPPGSAIQPDVIFDPDGVLTTTQGTGSTSNVADAVRLEANLSYQSLAADNDLSDKFFIDDLRISVTSDSATARIWLPNGTSVLVNEPVGLPGDFNGDTVVDAADYTNWRDNLGAADETSINFNGDGGDVGASDYDLWKSAFGTPGSGGIGVGVVPEPGSILLLVMGLAGFSFRRRKCR